MKRRHLLTALLMPALACAVVPQAFAGGAPKEKKKGGGPSFTQFPMISVYIPRRDGRHATMTIEMGLDVKDPKLAELIPVYIPRLRDAYVSRIQAYGLRLRENSLIDPGFITRELQAATDQVLKKSGATVLLGTMLIN
ncbi:Tat pathway signal protein [Asticcacaulis machinosus]|uniref:Tat pathway signal protein n=1 Tax=Asticcacaulis machinosus TaxID=2984211 RepID=A0ABT5HJD9_9CAUL|nr:Tat pathway signal protein [Asticcacaulis machinosus]MDC7676338.1 Tat pathway signal protein [Asticcacaulis machinosus]